MGLAWQLIGRVMIPARPAGYWTLASEFVPGARLLRIHTLTEKHEPRPEPAVWSALNGRACGPDGDFPPGGNALAGAEGGAGAAGSAGAAGGNTNLPAKTAMLCASAPYGALIGKIGGSTADLPDLTQAVTAPYGTKKVFAVGSDAIIALAAGDGGPLFLTMNDRPEEFPKHDGKIEVFLEYYPL